MNLFLVHLDKLIPHLRPGREIETIYDEIGFQKEKGYSGFNVSLQKWNKLLNLYKLALQTPETSVDYINGDLRKTVIGDSTTFLQKTRITSINLGDYPLKINVKDEIPQTIETEFKYDLIRNKTRYSYIFPDGFSRLDLTTVITTSKNTTHITYEVELEFINSALANTQNIGVSSIFSITRDTNLPLQSYLQNVSKVLKDLQETENLYTITQRVNLTSWFNRNFSTDQFYANPKTPAGKINEDMIPKARNLKIKDIKYGGLVGNSRTRYSATKKADGYQKILIVYEDGLWLVSSADVNWVYALVANNMNVNLQKLFGFVTIGELVPPEKRLSGSPTSKYWFIQFDTINWYPSFDDTKRSNITKTGVKINKSTLNLYINPKKTQDLPRPDRHRVCDIVKENLTGDLLTIWTKEFRAFETVDEFYSVIIYLTSDLSNENQAFENDGLVFTPEDTPFNSRSDQYPLYQRTLTRYPDICKWKPPEDLTIDFVVRRMISGIVTLFSGRPRQYLNLKNRDKNGKPIKDDQVALRYGFPENKGVQLLEFKGSKTNAFNSSDIDLTGLENIPDNSTAEFEFDQKTKKLRFRLLREKFPNTYEVAEDVWDDIHRPITIETLRGESSALVRYYHNNLKRDLFYYDQGNGTKTLIDIGAGKGGSVYNYNSYSKVLAIEPNADNIVELRSRIQNAGLENKVKILQTGGENTALITDTANEWLGGPADTITMMLSLSFFFQSSEILNALTQTISQNLKLGGNFLFLTIDGTVVSEIFEPTLLERSPYIVQITEGLLLSIPNIAEFTYLGNETLLVNIFESIVGEQKEWLVRLNDLHILLANIGLRSIEYKRATSEKFLSLWEQMYTNMYSSGIYNRHKLINVSMEYNILSATQIETKLTEDENKMVESGMQILENKKNTFEKEMSTINFNSTQTLELDEEYEPNLSEIKSPRANLVHTSQNINILPITNTLADIKIQDYSDDALTTPIPVTISPRPRIESNLTQADTITDAGVPITLDTTIPIHSYAEPNTFNSVYNLLNEEAKELVTMNNINQNLELKAESVPVENETLPFLEVKKESQDDKLEPIFENIVKISTISGTNAFFHAFLKTFYPKYNQISGLAYRENLVVEFRKELSDILSLQDEKNAGKTYYDTLLNFTAETYNNVQVSMVEYKTLLLSNESIGLDLMKFISYILNIDLILVLVYPTDIRIIYRTGAQNPAVILYGKNEKFEPIGVVRNGLVQTVFPSSDPFLQTLNSDIQNP